MEQYLSFVTIDVWTMVFTWGNLLILFLLLKKFLFKPVRAMIEKRQQEVKDLYAAADHSNQKAQALKTQYETCLENAKYDADEIIKKATKTAQQKSEEIIGKAHKQAGDIVARADEQIKAEKKNAENVLKNEISEMAISIASKVIEKDLTAADHDALINQFIEELGEKQ